MTDIPFFNFVYFVFIFSYSAQTTLSIQLQYVTSSLKWKDLIFQLLLIDFSESAANVKINSE